MIRLTNRLSAAASLVRGGGSIADVGTDHAYLPVYLCQTGKIKRAVASDIGEGPLENAARTVERFGLSDRIGLRLSDGLAAYAPGEVDEILICGMGGELIAGILRATPWICRPGMHLVLQPMSHGVDVRRFLCENGFQIENELCVSEGRRVYLCFSANWTGQDERRPEAYYYFGELPAADATARTLQKRVYAHLRTRADALRKAGRLAGEEAALRAVIETYERMCLDDGQRNF